MYHEVDLAFANPVQRGGVADENNIIFAPPSREIIGALCFMKMFFWDGLSFSRPLIPLHLDKANARP